MEPRQETNGKDISGDAVTYGPRRILMAPLLKLKSIDRYMYGLISSKRTLQVWRKAMPLPNLVRGPTDTLAKSKVMNEEPSDALEILLAIVDRRPRRYS